MTSTPNILIVHFDSNYIRFKYFILIAIKPYWIQVDIFPTYNQPKTLHELYIARICSSKSLERNVCQPMDYGEREKEFTKGTHISVNAIANVRKKWNIIHTDSQENSSYPGERLSRKKWGGCKCTKSETWGGLWLLE